MRGLSAAVLITEPDRLFGSPAGRVGDITDWYGEWVAIRRHPISDEAARRSLVNVVAARTLDDLAGKLIEQSHIEDVPAGARHLRAVKPPAA
ncbi:MULTISPECIES: hypothetical protein [Streptosporangium]|uniref:Uncharacterized protein n=1 Tax=Streptosporangium brasiliense TaxID=47480 RepID=A0ABT9RKJ3_9ACTN|nr:hypothetical protein [Streptosporangium brasiliense]MDP9868790.1 hypothetical protein [Streptosporangium brasiliense]